LIIRGGGRFLSQKTSDEGDTLGGIKPVTNKLPRILEKGVMPDTYGEKKRFGDS